MTSPFRLGRLSDAVRDALGGTFDSIATGIAEVVEAEVQDAGADALAGLDAPAVVALAAPTEGVTGPAVLAVSVAGARRLAAVLGAIDEEEAEFGAQDVGDRELSAFREATTKVTAAVASAVTAVYDREASFRPASVRVAEGAADLPVPVEVGTSAIVVAFSLMGETARFALLVPDTLGSQASGAAAGGPVPQVVGEHPLGGALRSVNVRVWAELGRTRMPTGQVVGLPAGAIVELDHDAEDAVELYVDGQRYATGRLVVTDDESWGVRIEQILAPR